MNAVWVLSVLVHRLSFCFTVVYYVLQHCFLLFSYQFHVYYFIIVVASLPVYSQFGRTPLHLAANSGKLESVKALVKEFGVDPDITDGVSI